MAIKLMTIKEPTNIFIMSMLGNGHDLCKTKFGIDDDYTGVDLLVGTDKYTFECDGYVYLFTRSELEELKDELEDNFFDEDSYDQNVYMIKEFTGDILLKAYDDKHQDILEEDFDLADNYIEHELQDVNTTIEIKETNLYKFNAFKDLIRYINHEPADMVQCFKPLTLHQKNDIFSQFLLKMHATFRYGADEDRAEILDKLRTFYHVSTNSYEGQSSHDFGLLMNKTIKDLV